jgi:K+-transporting ATPase KdpF subunit
LIGSCDDADPGKRLLWRLGVLGTPFGHTAPNALACLQLSFWWRGLSVSPSFSNPSIISKKSKTMMTAMFILSILVFVYLLYVLLKPEKF